MARVMDFRVMDFTQHLMPKAPDQEVRVPMEPPQPAANVEISGRSPEERIAKLQSEYKFDSFNPDDLDCIKRCEQQDVLAAFQNL